MILIEWLIISLGEVCVGDSILKLLGLGKLGFDSGCSDFSLGYNSIKLEN